MSIRKFGDKNMFEVTIDQRKVLYSYKTPVVVFDGEHFFVTTERHSQTTSRHINLYLTEALRAGLSKAGDPNYLVPSLLKKLIDRLGFGRSLADPIKASMI